MKQSQSLPSKKEIEILLNSQTKVLLGAVDGKIGKLEKSVDKKTVETQRHFDVVAEDLRSSMAQIAEGVSTNSELIERLGKRVEIIETQINNLQGMRSSVESMREDVLKIRVRLETLQNKIEKNPNYNDLAALDKRVWLLEKRVQSS